eukprot:TRINITY_DN18464_c0_g1_i1.p1 TRINITY_DN18464_c0_g1~~TRINITY_DN18464_c0_g1_i1.p1  ORF type:complete len:266 (-),score=67.48 TRINITY_DN18464_c0_g1_i1:128-904(-)
MTAAAATSAVALAYNPNSPSVRRILSEWREATASASADVRAAPLEDNLFEWHFTFTGPEDSEFAGGVYHGRLILPAEYPMKPPNIVLLTPNGRFEVGAKICLNASAYHPEEWQPSWGIKTLLVAIRTFMTTPGKGAVGALDLPASERRLLAEQSRSWVCKRCGTPNAALFADAGEPVPAEPTPEAAMPSPALVPSPALMPSPAPAVPTPTPVTAPPRPATQPQAQPPTPARNRVLDISLVVLVGLVLALLAQKWLRGR